MHHLVKFCNSSSLALKIFFKLPYKNKLDGIPLETELPPALELLLPSPLLYSTE